MMQRTHGTMRWLWIATIGAAALSGIGAAAQTRNDTASGARAAGAQSPRARPAAAAKPTTGKGVHPLGSGPHPTAPATKAVFGPPAPTQPTVATRAASGAGSLTSTVPVPVVDYRLSAISAVAFSPDGKQLAVGAFGQVVVFETSHWQPTATFRNVLDSVRSLCFAPDGSTLAIGCGFAARNGETILWSPGAAGAGRILVGQKDAVEAITFSKDGKQLLIGADDNTARWFQ